MPSLDHPAVSLPTSRSCPFDPPDGLDRIREEAPVHRLRYPDGTEGWLVTGYAAGRALLSDARFSAAVDPWKSPADFDLERTRAMLDEMADDVLPAHSAGFFLTMDRPEHTRFRQLLATHFTVRGVGRLRPHLEDITRARLDAMEAVGPPVDFVATFALPMTSLAICALLGVPYEEHERFDRRDTAMQDPESSAEERAAAWRDFADLLGGVVERKRAQPGDDLMSQLVQVGELTDQELVGVGMFLTSAGHHTTTNQLALGMFALLDDRDRWEALVRDPSLVDSAVEELLRYLTILQLGTSNRTALEDVEIGDAVIRQGDSVAISLLACNRDPQAFENPDTLELSRDAGGHLAFGWGIHMCLGQHLARLELRIAFTALIERFPELRLAVTPDEISMHPGDADVYGPHELLVEW